MNWCILNFVSSREIVDIIPAEFVTILGYIVQLIFLVRLILATASQISCSKFCNLVIFKMFLPRCKAGVISSKLRLIANSFLGNNLSSYLEK